MEKVTKTITIDKEVEEYIEKLRKSEKRSFSSMCNVLLGRNKK